MNKFFICVHFIVSTFLHLLLLSMISGNSVTNELIEASFIANLKKIKWLMSLDPTILSPNLPIVDVNSKDLEHGRTALLVCGSDPQNDDISIVDNKCTAIAKLLIKGGANLSHIDNYGWNAVALGAMRGHVKYCRYLIDKGIDSDLTDNKGRTPIMKISAHGNSDLFKILFDSGASLTRKDSSGMTALHYSTNLALNNASYIPFLDKICLHLYSKSFNINDPVDKHNRTILMYAAINNDYEISKVLIKYGADPRLTDQYGISAVSMPSNKTIVNLLMDTIISIVDVEHKIWIAETDAFKDDL